MKALSTWLEKGYQHFGQYGPEKLSIKKIAEEASISRTSFNYYFKNKDEFIDELLLQHFDLNTRFCEFGKQYCTNYLPDIHELVLMFTDGFRFQKQLFQYRNISKFNIAFIACNDISAKKFVTQLFIDYYKLPLNFEAASNLHETLLETWYSRTDFNDLNLEELVHSTEEIMQSLSIIFKSSETPAISI